MMARGRPHNAQRTAAQHPQFSGGGRPWAEETEKFETAPSRGAEWADRAEREAWAGRVFKSAYAHLVDIPDRVEPGDRVTAYRVKVQIEAAMDLGGYTGNEWNRLHKMLTDWGSRAAGEDVGFMLRGWRRQGSGHHRPSIEKVVDQIKKEMEKWQEK